MGALRGLRQRFADGRRDNSPAHGLPIRASRDKPLNRYRPEMEGSGHLRPLLDLSLKPNNELETLGMDEIRELGDLELL